MTGSFNVGNYHATIWINDKNTNATLVLKIILAIYLQYPYKLQQ